MTNKKTNTAKKVSIANTNSNPTPLVPVSGSIIALNENSMRAVATLAASMMFSQPQFAAQTNPSNILGLADLFYKYMQGSINVTQPSEELSESGQSAPKFG